MSGTAQGSARVVELDRGRWRYKMKDLCDASGLERQAIHFYIQQGLLPPGRKTGRNMAWYSDEHLQRLQWIKKLQHERFLPLKAIKAVLDGEEDIFPPEQHAFLANVKEKLGEEFRPTADRSQTISAAEVRQRTGIDEEDIREAVDIGLVGGVKDEDGTIRIAAADLWTFELFGEARKLGFTRERGFTMEVFGFYEDLMNRLLNEEVHLLSSRLRDLPPEEVAQMIERVLPIIHAYLTRMHSSKIRNFFADVL